MDELRNRGIPGQRSPWRAKGGDTGRSAWISGLAARGAGLLLAGALSGCAGVEVDPLPEPLRPPKALPEAMSGAAAAAQAEEGTTITPTPGVVIGRTFARGIADSLGEDLTGPPIAVSFHDVPLVTFINEVFAERLGMSFTLGAGLSGKQDLVTLRLTEPVSPSQLFSTARRVLQDYGVDLRETDGVLTFSADQEITSRDIPLLISGRTLPAVPPTHRVVFQLVPLRVVQPRMVIGLLNQAMAGQDLQVTDDTLRNSLLLRGSVEMVRRAADLIEVLDQPLLRGRFGMIIEPGFLLAEDMANDLDDVLQAEGYNVRVGDSLGGSVILLPMRSVNKLVVFAQDQAALEHVRDWARELDAKKEATIENAVFTYEVRNTQAASLQETLDAILLGGTDDAEDVPVPVGLAEDDSSRGSGRIVVDENRNMLLFRGSGKEWAELRAVIDQLDKPVPSVLIEVLVAEITLSGEQESGIEFLFRNGIGSERTVTSSTLDALGVKAKALSLTLDSAGMTRAVLNTFYDDSRVAIRSSARLMVKSGESATFDAGNEIPTISQISDAGIQAGGSTNVLQQVTYRTTGVVLQIDPVVQAGGLVDLAISQELSEAQPAAATSLDGTPTILSRRIQTSLTLRDGGSLLMGGLVSNNQTEGQAGIPGVSRVPLLGRLFRKDALLKARTELAILVIPYVVANHEEGQELTERIKASLDLHRQFLR